MTTTPNGGTAPLSGSETTPVVTSTSSTGTKVLGIIAVVLGALVIIMGLFVTAGDAQLDETMRVIYMHVPTVSVAYMSFVLTAVCSVMYIWKRTEFWDLLAASSAEVGVLFFGLTILNGMLWGRITWGVYWRWDPRLTTSAILLLMYIGYLAVRSIPADFKTRAMRSSIIGIVAVLNIPIVHNAVDWWRSLHQEGTILGSQLFDPQMEGSQLFTMYMSLTLGLIVFVWLLLHRYRVAFMAERVQERALVDAIAERRAEGGTASTGVVS